MDGLGRAIGAGVPIQFNGETVILEGVTIGDFGVIEQHLLAQRPNPMDLARPQAMEFIREAALMAPGIEIRKARIALLESLPKPLANEKVELTELQAAVAVDESVKAEYVSMAEKLMADARTEAMRKNKISPREVAAWIDTVEGLTFTLWMKLGKRYPGKYSLEQTQQIMQSMHDSDQDRLKKLRDQASGLDSLGNSTGPTLTAAEAGPTGG